MADYSFVTLWRFRAPLKPVWEMVYHSEEWPAWWRGVERVERVEPGDEKGIGTLQLYTWRSKLPYRLAFHMRLTRVEPLALIEGEAVGELTGTGRWQLTHDAGITDVRYDWHVRTTKPWMNLLRRSTPSLRARPSAPQSMTTSWFHLKMGRATGASRFIQGLVVRTCQS